MTRIVDMVHRTATACAVGLAGIVLALGALALGSSAARAQSVPSAPAGNEAGERYFHRAAQQYLAENIAEARRLVDEGLRAAPGHPKLTALRRKLRQEGAQPQADSTAQEQEGQSQQQGGQRQGQSQGAEDRGERSGDQGPQQQRGPQGQESPRDPSQQPADRRGPDGQPQPRAGAQGEQPTDRLSRAQAERILRALENQEKQLLREVQRRPSPSTPVEKDW